MGALVYGQSGQGPQEPPLGAPADFYASVLSLSTQGQKNRVLNHANLKSMAVGPGPEGGNVRAPVRRWDCAAGAEIRGQRSERIPESRCDFILQDTDGKL